MDKQKVWQVAIQHLYTMHIEVEASDEDDAMASAYSLSEEIPFSEWESDVFTEIVFTEIIKRPDNSEEK